MNPVICTSTLVLVPAERSSPVRAQLAARYEVLVGRVKKEEGEERSQAYYVIKAAQEREQLQREGDQLDAQIRQVRGSRGGGTPPAGGPARAVGHFLGPHVRQLLQRQDLSRFAVGRIIDTESKQPSPATFAHMRSRGSQVLISWDT